MTSSRTIVVVGASRGIGHALVTSFASQPNANVIGTVRKSSDGDYGLTNTSSILLDMNDPTSVTKAASQLPAIDVLMVNGGMGIAEPILNLEEASFQNYLDINLKGPWRLVKAFLPALRTGNEKKIVFTSSMSGSMQLNYEGKASVRGAYAVTKVSRTAQSCC